MTNYLNFKKKLPIMHNEWTLSCRKLKNDVAGKDVWPKFSLYTPTHKIFFLPQEKKWYIPIIL